MLSIIKIMVIILCVSIIFALGSALYYLIRGDGKQNSEKMVKALTWRIGLSFLLFLILFLGFALGWIEPHSILAR